jgi:hypothetical protein
LSLNHIAFHSHIQHCPRKPDVRNVTAGEAHHEEVAIVERQVTDYLVRLRWLSSLRWSTFHWAPLDVSRPCSTPTLGHLNRRPRRFAEARITQTTAATKLDMLRLAKEKGPLEEAEDWSDVG